MNILSTISLKFLGSAPDVGYAPLVILKIVAPKITGSSLSPGHKENKKICNVCML